MRGFISIALALSISTVLADCEGIIATVFGTVLFTLIVQGLTIQPLLKQLNLLREQTVREQYMERVAHQVALNRVLKDLSQAEQRSGIEQSFIAIKKHWSRGRLSDCSGRLSNF